MRTMAACNFLMLALGYHRLLYRWWGICALKTEARKLDVNVVKEKLLKTWETENVLDMSRQRKCSDVSELYCRERKCGLLSVSPVVQSSTTDINIYVVADENKENQFKTLNQFRNVY